MAEMIEISIDGTECSCERGEYLYDVARRNGIWIPTLCRHDAFEPRAACRLCIVEVTQLGRTKVVTSCAYPVEDACEVSTKSERILRERRVILSLLAARAPEAKQISGLLKANRMDPVRGLVKIDGEKCILCGLCMQVCESLETGAISTVMRGIEKRVDTPYNKANPECIGCLSCAEICPTDAIPFSQDDEQLNRTIWHRRFELVRCERCGEIIGTPDEIANAASKSVEMPSTMCASCKARTTADKMTSGFRR